MPARPRHAPEIQAARYVAAPPLLDTSPHRQQHFEPPPANRLNTRPVRQNCWGFTGLQGDDTDRQVVQHGLSGFEMDAKTIACAIAGFLAFRTFG